MKSKLIAILSILLLMISIWLPCYADEAATSTYALTRDRETACSSMSVVDDSSAVISYLNETLSADTASKICVQHYVTRDQIDESVGILDNTQTILERTYDYYDTYNGIKIADSYVGASIDCEGINNVTDERKTVVSVGETASDSPARSIVLISQNEAITIAQAENSCCEELDIRSVALAYAPTENGSHVLCYEIRATCGFIYVDVQTGDIVNWI